MGPSHHFAASLSILLAMTSAAHATVGCTVASLEVGAERANLYYDPDDASKVIREIPLGDIVRYLDEELAPVEVEGWVWVRHDITQEDIWTTNRAYEVVEANNAPVATSVPEVNPSASSPTPQATMTIAATAQPAVSTERAEPGIDQNLSLIFSGSLALLVVGLVFVVQLIKKR